MSEEAKNDMFSREVAAMPDALRILSKDYIGGDAFVHRTCLQNAATLIEVLVKRLEQADKENAELRKDKEPLEWRCAKSHPLCEYKVERGDDGWPQTNYTFHEGYDALRVFAVKINDDDLHYCFGRLSEDGSIVQLDGDSFEWDAEDISHWAYMTLPGESEASHG